MALSWSDVAAVAARWSISLRAELDALAIDARHLLEQLKTRWDCDPDFQSQIIHEAVEGLLLVIVRGPRATVLYIAGVTVGFVVFVIAALSDEGEGFSPAL